MRAVLAVCGLVLGMFVLAPQIGEGDQREFRQPVTSPTSTEAPVHPAVDKTDLIVQQNVHCWNAVPGRECGPDRTYQ